MIAVFFVDFSLQLVSYSRILKILSIYWLWVYNLDQENSWQSCPSVLAQQYETNEVEWFIWNDSCQVDSFDFWHSLFSLCVCNPEHAKLKWHHLFLYVWQKLIVPPVRYFKFHSNHSNCNSAESKLLWRTQVYCLDYAGCMIPDPVFIPSSRTIAIKCPVQLKLCLNTKTCQFYHLHQTKVMFSFERITHDCYQNNNENVFI